MRIKFILIGLLVIIGLRTNASGNLSSIKATYIYNFLRLISWPETGNSTNFVIGVMGDDETYEQLASLTANRKVGMKDIQVKRISSAQEAAICQLVFVPSNQSKKIAELKSLLGNKPCLIVSEKEGLNASGSTIEFVIQEGKLKFRINEERAKQINLTVSRTLLDMSA